MTYDPRPLICATALALVLIATAMHGCAKADGVHPTPAEIAACGFDATRLCGTANGSTQNAQQVLSCLQRSRASLSKACAALLLSEGK